jgi:hypothetical protein
MKLTLTVAAFLGYVSADIPSAPCATCVKYGPVAHQPVWSLQSVNDHRTDASLQKDFGDHATT